MLRADRLRTLKDHDEVARAIEAALVAESSQGQDRETALDVLTEMIPRLKRLGIWTGSSSRQAVKALATMLAGLEGQQSL